MGEALDKNGNMLGSAVGPTKMDVDVLKALDQNHPDSAEVRIRSMEAEVAGRGYITASEGPISNQSQRGSLDRRIERHIRGLQEQSAHATTLLYLANQLNAFLDCLPRRLDPAAAEGLKYLLMKAGL